MTKKQKKRQYKDWPIEHKISRARADVRHAKKELLWENDRFHGGDPEKVRAIEKRIEKAEVRLASLLGASK